MELEKCCKNCKTGDKHLANFEAKKDKMLSLTEYINREFGLGHLCISCKYNGVMGRAAWAARRKSKMFQTIDHFEANK